MKKLIAAMVILVGFLVVQGVRSQNILEKGGTNIVKPGVPVAPVTKADSIILPGAEALVIDSNNGNNARLLPISVNNGERVNGKDPIVLGNNYGMGFSNDSTLMAVVSEKTSDCKGLCLQIMDLREWKDLVAPIKVSENRTAWATIPEFDSHGSMIPILIGSDSSRTEVLLVDWKHAKISASIKLKASAYEISFGPNGSLIIIGNKPSVIEGPGAIYTALLDGKDLTIKWEYEVTQVKLSDGVAPDPSDLTKGTYYQPAEIMAHDGTKLYIVAADEPTLVTVDYQTRQVTNSHIAPQLSLFEKIMAFGLHQAQAKMMNGVYKSGTISPDGRYLYVLGQENHAFKNDKGDYQSETKPLGLQVIDTTDGLLIKEIPTQATQAYLTEDSRTLLMNGWTISDSDQQPWTEVLDLATGKVNTTLAGTIIPSKLLDGTTAWLSTQPYHGNGSIIAVYRPGENKPVSQITNNDYVDWVILPVTEP